jgi:hypothetical protein
MNIKMRKIPCDEIDKKFNFHLIEAIFSVIIFLSSTACVAATSAKKSPSIWPNNGIAQHQFFNGGLMFVENDKNKWRAWVISDYSR